MAKPYRWSPWCKLPSRCYSLRPPHRDQRLGQPERALAKYRGARDQVLQLRSIEEMNLGEIMLQVKSSPIGRGPNNHRPQINSRHDAALPAWRQPVHDRREQVLFDWKPAIGGLGPESPADAHDFLREPSLTVRVADVFDHRVGKNDIEFAIAKWKSAAVARDPGLRAQHLITCTRRVQ